jgi:hypothetical protein
MEIQHVRLCSLDITPFTLKQVRAGSAITQSVRAGTRFTWYFDALPKHLENACALD